MIFIFLFHFLNYITTHFFVQRNFFVAFTLRFCNEKNLFRCNRCATILFCTCLSCELLLQSITLFLCKMQKKLTNCRNFRGQSAFKLAFIYFCGGNHCNANFALRLRCTFATQILPFVAIVAQR